MVNKFYLASVLVIAVSVSTLIITLLMVPVIFSQIADVWKEIDSEIATYKVLANKAWDAMILLERSQDYTRWARETDMEMVDEEPRNISDRAIEPFEAFHPITLVVINDTCTCRSTHTCPPGHTGPPGSNADPGEDGTPGDEGLPGIPAGMVEAQLRSKEGCYVCDRGEPGTPGKVGVKGRVGMKGLPGTVGSGGRNGSPGGRGPTGLPGKKGVNGTQGPKGSSGKDFTLPKGLPGPKGEKGLVGGQGMMGKSGRSAFPGPRGLKGPKGHAGLDGLPGMPGAVGAQGPPGSPGQDASYCPCPLRVVTETPPAGYICDDFGCEYFTFD